MFKEDSMQILTQIKSDPLFPSRRPNKASGTLISQQHLSGRQGNTIQTPISGQKVRTVQGCIRSNVVATRLDAH
jgi:hypothetical protein